MSSKDDLTRVKGIGPVAAKKLYAKKVRTFDHLAKLSTTEINEIIGRKVAKKRWRSEAKEFATRQTTKAKRKTSKRKTSKRKTSKRKAAKKKSSDLLCSHDSVKDFLKTLRASKGGKRGTARAKSTKTKQARSKNKTQTLVKHKNLEKLGFRSWQLRIKEVEAVVEKVSANLFAKYEHIAQIEVGEKMIDGEGTKIPAIKILVEKKIKKSKLKRSQIIPALIEGVPTDVETCKTGKFHLARSIRGGDSFKPAGGSNGTVGIVGTVGRGNDKKIVFVTAAHVVRGNKKIADLSDNTVIVMKKGKDVGFAPTVAELFQESQQGDLAFVLAADGTSPKANIKGFPRLKFRSPKRTDKGKTIVKIGLDGKKGEGTIEEISGDRGIDAEPNDHISFVTDHIVIDIDDSQAKNFKRGDSGAAIIQKKDKAIIGFLRAIAFSDDAQKHATKVIATPFRFVADSDLTGLKIFKT